MKLRAANVAEFHWTFFSFYVFQKTLPFLSRFSSSYMVISSTAPLLSLFFIQNRSQISSERCAIGSRYPNDLSKRAKIHSVLDWHHTNLRPSAAPFLGLPLNSAAAAEAEKLLTKSMSSLETVWLKDNAKFLAGSNQPSIADLSLVCELMQLQVLDEKDHLRLFSPYKKVEEWIDNTRKATMPHFDEVHKTLLRLKERVEKQREMGTVSKPGLQSKM